jgi:hypothetical protein
VIFLLLCSFSSTEIAAYLGLLFTSNELILTKNGLDYILGAFGRFWAALLGFFHKLIQSLCLQFVFSFQKSVIVVGGYATAELSSVEILDTATNSWDQSHKKSFRPKAFRTNFYHHILVKLPPKSNRY